MTGTLDTNIQSIQYYFENKEKTSADLHLPLLLC